MKKLLSLVFILFINLSVLAQVTNNPRINWKSTQNVYINKIEITADNTIFYMQFWDNSPKQTFDEFIRENPDIARKFRQMGLSRAQAERIFREQYSTQQTISFQPGSKIILSNGQAYGFIRAVNIPVAPQRKDVESGQKYFFQVYFERIPPGFESIELREDDQNTDGSFQFWNFSGIQINNPKNQQPEQKPQQKPKEDNNVLITDDFRLYGKVLDAISAQPLNAKIVCTTINKSKIIDSLQTSNSGKYEFLIDENKIEYSVTAKGYSPFTETIDLSLFLKNGSLEKDIYMLPIRVIEDKPMPIEVKKDTVVIEENTPVIVEKEPEVVSVDSTQTEKVPVIVEKEPEVVSVDSTETEETPEIDDNIGEKLDKTATSFKLNKVYFNVSKADILEESHEQLNNLANYLLANPDFKIEIEGHTDNQGDQRANKKLSMDRAYNVRNYLVSKGVKKNRIKFTGYGSTRPVAPNDTEENRSKNRRVEYKFIK